MNIKPGDMVKIKGAVESVDKDGVVRVTVKAKRPVKVTEGTWTVEIPAADVEKPEASA